MDSVPGFESSHFRFRLLDADDQKLFCGLFTDEVTMDLIGATLSDEAALAFFRSAQRANLRHPGRDLFFSIRCKRTDDEVGLCTLQRIDWPSRCAEVGLMLKPGKQHRRLGREILETLVRSAFEVFGFECLQASYRAENLAAKRLFARCGFVEARHAERDVDSLPEKAILTVQEWRTVN